MTGQELASAAHEALRRGEQAQALSLFAAAARAEEQAFSEVDPGRTRTKAILAISATSLWYKAGDLKAAEQFAHQASTIPNLPAFARNELRDLLQASSGPLFRLWTGAGLS